MQPGPGLQCSGGWGVRRASRGRGERNIRTEEGGGNTQLRGRGALGPEGVKQHKLIKGELGIPWIWRGGWQLAGVGGG